jgi:hypothetical protein
MGKKKTEMTEIEKIICSKFTDTQIPQNITIDRKGDEVTIKLLDGKKIVEGNMQEVGNAFEGWAIVAHACIKKDVVLYVNDCSCFPKDGYIGHGHYNRFLYRIMKFKEQYEWFKLEDSLGKKADDFRDYLKKEKGFLVNNTPKDEAGGNDQNCNENSIEKLMAEKGVLKEILGDTPNVGDNLVHRQLPVGLFNREKLKDKSIFTYGHSAIDLWNINGDTINVVELKYKNKMIGIITEAFFYSNFILDLVDNKGLFSLAEGNDCRGYSELKKGMSRVNGIMLADSYHPCLDKEIIEYELNHNKNADKLKYYIAKYCANVTVSKNVMNIEIQKAL